MAHYRILGPLEASVGERSLPTGGPTQLKLFAFLVLHANRAVSSDVLIDAVWGPSRSGAAKLQMAIARLRQTLRPLDRDGKPALLTVGGGYLLAMAPGMLDAEVLQERVHGGRCALAAGDHARAGELLRAALGLWRGPPLAELSYEDFAQPEIRRLEELRLEALQSRIEADLRLGLHAQLIGELESLLVQHRSRERLAGQLMLALYRSGRQGEALEIYQRTRAYLAQELGLEPGPALKAIQSQILQQTVPLQESSVGREDVVDEQADSRLLVGLW